MKDRFLVRRSSTSSGSRTSRSCASRMPPTGRRSTRPTRWLRASSGSSHAYGSVLAEGDPSSSRRAQVLVAPFVADGRDERAARPGCARSRPGGMASIAKVAAIFFAPSHREAALDRVALDHGDVGKIGQQAARGGGQLGVDLERGDVARRPDDERREGCPVPGAGAELHHRVALRQTQEPERQQVRVQPRWIARPSSSRAGACRRRCARSAGRTKRSRGTSNSAASRCGSKNPSWRSTESTRESRHRASPSSRGSRPGPPLLPPSPSTRPGTRATQAARTARGVAIFLRTSTVKRRGRGPTDRLGSR